MLFWYISTYAVYMLFLFCSSILNELVSLYSGPPSELATDVLVLPLCVDLHGDHQNCMFIGVWLSPVYTMYMQLP